MSSTFLSTSNWSSYGFISKKCFLFLTSHLHLTLNQILPKDYCNSLLYASVHPISTHCIRVIFLKINVHKFWSLKGCIVFMTCKTKSIIFILAYQAFYNAGKANSFTLFSNFSFTQHRNPPSLSMAWLLTMCTGPYWFPSLSSFLLADYIHHFGRRSTSVSTAFPDSIYHQPHELRGPVYWLISYFYLIFFPLNFPVRIKSNNY